MNLSKKQNIKVWWVIPSSGILIGLNAPGFGTEWVGFISLIPLVWLLEKTFLNPNLSQKKKLFLSLLFCWLSAGIGSSIGAYWITHSAHVFGHLPWFGAVSVTFIGYGLEVGLLLWIALAGPLVILRHGLQMISTNLLIAEWFTPEHNKSNIPMLKSLSICTGMLFLAAAGYGMIKQDSLRKTSSTEKSSQKIWIGSVQPNFSLQDLASNPDLAHSERRQNLDSLFKDSEALLRSYPQESGLPKLIVWPESVYPDPFFKKDLSRKRVLQWAEKHQTSILLASIDWEMGKTGPRFFGISVMVGPNGKIIGRYNKIFLIPFGETLPFSEWFPEIAEWLRKEIRNMSEFEKGTEYTVFQLNPELQVSASICFDIFSTEIVRNMTRNGAGFVANLSNLAWFGKTTATHSMEAFVRWRAIENRVPILFASNNGSSVLIGPDGQPLSPYLGLFKTGLMGETVSIGSHYSFYREHSEIVRITFILLMLVSGWFAIRQRRKQKDDSG